MSGCVSSGESVLQKLTESVVAHLLSTTLVIHRGIVAFFASAALLADAFSFVVIESVKKGGYLFFLLSPFAFARTKDIIKKEKKYVQIFH